MFKNHHYVILINSTQKQARYIFVNYRGIILLILRDSFFLNRLVNNAKKIQDFWRIFFLYFNQSIFLHGIESSTSLQKKRTKNQTPPGFINLRYEKNMIPWTLYSTFALPHRILLIHCPHRHIALVKINIWDLVFNRNRLQSIILMRECVFNITKMCDINFVFIKV